MGSYLSLATHDKEAVETLEKIRNIQGIHSLHAEMTLSLGRDGKYCENEKCAPPELGITRQTVSKVVQGMGF